MKNRMCFVVFVLSFLLCTVLSAWAIAAEGYSFVSKLTTPDPLPGDRQFATPRSVAIDRSGNIYVLDAGVVAGGRAFVQPSIRKFSSDGTFIAKWGSYGTADNQFKDPYGMAVDSSGNVYVADTGNNRIQKFDSDGKLITKWGSQGDEDDQFLLPVDVAVDSAGNVYVLDQGFVRAGVRNPSIKKFGSNGRFLAKWGKYGGMDGEFDFPWGIVADSSGNVFVSDAGARPERNRIQKFSTNGAFMGKWGYYGTGNGQFKQARCVAVDSSGKIYVADKDNNRIQKFSPDGTFMVKWGSYGTGDGQFKSPLDVAVDTSGNVYVVDYGRVQKFRPVPLLERKIIPLSPIRVVPTR